MYIIIPALIKNEHSIVLLQRTIDKINLTLVIQIIIVLQGQKLKKNNPEYIEFNNLKTPLILQDKNKFTIINFEKRLSKWKAIEIGRDKLPSNKMMVLLLDADDPIEEKSFINLQKTISKTNADCIIGKRNKIILYADDQKSTHSRVFLELFTNTLLLLNNSRQENLKEFPDIQSGIFSLKSSYLKGIDFSYIEQYGGELSMYYQLAQKNIHFITVKIKTNASLQSTYKVDEIVDAIFKLPYFKNINNQIISEAIVKTPSFYFEYFKNINQKEYIKEITKILKLS